GRRFVATALMSAVLFTGTKISIALIFIVTVGFWVFDRDGFKQLVSNAIRPAVVAVSFYVILAVSSPALIAAGNQLVAAISPQDSTLAGLQIGTAETCRTWLDCIETRCTEGP